MADPVYPSLTLKYVDKNWFSGDQPVNEHPKLNDLETDHEALSRTQLLHNEPIEEPDNEDDDDDEMNDDEEDDEEVEEEEDGYMAE